MSWFDDNAHQPVTAGSGINQYQATTINDLIAKGTPLADIAAAVGLPASYIQSLTGYNMNGPANAATVDTSGSTGATGTPTNTTDPIQFIRDWQNSHPFTQDSLAQLKSALQSQFGIGAWQGTSGNEVDINGQKTKIYSEGGQSWYDPAGLSSDGAPSQTGTLANYLQGQNVPSYSATPYTPPKPFSYPSYTQGAPFTAPTAADVANDPAHQFRLQQGQLGIDRDASAKGTLLTGGTAKDLETFAQGLATQDYNTLFNQDYQTWAGNNAYSLDAYNASRNNAFQNYTTNAGISYGANALNNTNSLAAFTANLGAQNQYFNQGRATTLDAYNQGQDYLHNISNYYGLLAGATGVPSTYYGY